MPNPVNGETGRRRGRRHSSDVSGREALLKAAITSFAQRGYDGASLRMIAREADVDVALCARLFGNKAQLWQAVVDSLAATFESRRRPLLNGIVARAETEPRQAMLDFISFYADLCVDNPAMPAFLMQEATVSEQRIGIIQEQLMKPVMLPVIELVTAARQAGVVVCEDPAIFIRMLTSALSMLLSTPHLLPESSRKRGHLKERIIAEAQTIFLRPERATAPQTGADRF